MNYPVPMSKADLLELLEYVRAGAESGDTLEGLVHFGIPYPPAGDPADADFMVLARYRVGNLMGQGGVCVVGARSMSPTPRGVAYQDAHPECESMAAAETYAAVEAIVAALERDGLLTLDGNYEQAARTVLDALAPGSEPAS